MGAAIVAGASLVGYGVGKLLDNTTKKHGKNDLSPLDVAQIQRVEVRAHSNESIIRTDALQALINKAAGGGNQQTDNNPVVLSVNYSGFDAVKAPTHFESTIR